MSNEEQNTDLSFLEKMVLLGLDDKGWFSNSEHRIKYGMAGAILFELFAAGRITTDDKFIRVINKDTMDNPVMDNVLSLLKSCKKPRTLRSWIQRLVLKKLLIRKTVIKKLIEKKILRKEEYSLLWVMYQYKYPLVNHGIKQRLRQEIFDMILSGKKLDAREVMLVSMMENCKMVRKNFHTFDNYSKLRRQIREILSFSEQGDEMMQFVMMVHNAVNQAIVASNVSIHA